MRLYFNGCSHTYGDDLADPKNNAWPAVLSRQLGLDFVNDSISGGTNDRIIYRTIKHLDQFDQFYIAWTYTSRFTRYRSDNNHDVNFNSQLVHTLYSKDYNFTEYGKIHYKVWHNELYAFKSWLQNIIMLQRLFESEHKHYLMINTAPNHLDRWASGWQDFNNNVKSLVCFDCMSDDQLYHEHLEIQKLISLIDLTRFMEWNQWCLTDELAQHPVGKTGHLLEYGHVVTASRILNYNQH